MKKQILLSALLFSFGTIFSQYKVEPPEGYTLEIGNMVYMLEELKNRVTRMVQDMDMVQIDYHIDENANSIGALILHLAATEAYYQVESLENRSFTEEEEEKWMLGAGLGIASRDKIKGKPIKHYLDIWDEVRSKTLSGLKEKDDSWFAETPDGEVSHHWAWYHVMEHQVVHMGQISHIKKRIPK